MKLSELKQRLKGNEDKTVRFVLPDGAEVAAHAHVTEAARIDKRFVDCGGTFRAESYCRLQTWVANDLEHRLTAGKLLKILETAKAVLAAEDLEVDVEHEVGYISQFPLNEVSLEGGEVKLLLKTRHTACLALDQCCPKPTEIAEFPKLNFPLPPSLLRPVDGSKAGCCR